MSYNFATYSTNLNGTANGHLTPRPVNRTYWAALTAYEM